MTPSAAPGGPRLPKVAIVCHGHPSLSQGGAEIAAYALYRGLRQIGVDAIFIGACSRAERHRLFLADRNEFAVCFDAERREYFYHLAPRPVVDDLLRILREEDVGIVNFHHFLNIGMNALRAVRALPGLRCFFTMHEFLAMCQNHGQMITRSAQVLCEEATPEACLACFPEHSRSEFVLRKQAALQAFADFDGFISPSRFLADRFIRWGLDGARTTVIENGLLRRAAAPVARRPGGSWTFGFFGQINPFKGVDVLLEAAARLARDPDLAAGVRLRIHGNLVGQPEAFRERLDKALRKYPFLSYAGPYDNASVHRLMGECDYVIVPSRWWENSPVVIQEAYAAGVPVICSGIGGMAEKVPDGVSGLHFRVGDAADLVRVMRQAADAQQAAALRAGIPAVPGAADMALRYADFFAVRGAARGSEPAAALAGAGDAPGPH